MSEFNKCQKSFNDNVLEDLDINGFQECGRLNVLEIKNNFISSVKHSTPKNEIIPIFLKEGKNIFVLLRGTLK